jgi:hypothetical protein
MDLVPVLVYWIINRVSFFVWVTGSPFGLPVLKAFTWVDKAIFVSLSVHPPFIVAGKSRQTKAVLNKTGARSVKQASLA